CRGRPPTLRRGLPRGGGRAARVRPVEHARGGGLLRGVRAGGGPSARGEGRVRPHAGPRELAQRGRVRVLRAGAAVPGTPPAGDRRGLTPGGRGLGREPERGGGDG